MIKIIKKGSPIYQVTCPKCNTIFTYQDEDITEIVDAQSGWRFKNIKCPICAYMIDHDHITNHNSNK